MKNQILIYMTLMSVFTYNSYSQSEVKDGNKKYADYAYVDAIKTYERVAQKGYKSEDMFKKLGNSYYFNSEFEGAAKWYCELFAMTANVEPDYYYRYAQSLKATGQADKANKLLDEFNTRFSDDSRGKRYKQDSNYRDQIKANSGRYKIEDAGINSKYSDYGTFVHHNKIYFASARDTGNFTQRKHAWTDKYFTNLYVANIDSARIKKIKKALNTKFNESSPIFTKDGKTVYFTRNNYVEGKKGKDGNKITLVKIYKATLQNDKWLNITALPFASDNYSTAHPALSPDGKTLYFASDMPGTLGQSDIYKVSINDNGDFGLPENLGKTINTEGKETFPFVTNENEIYFASDGHPGLGGLDVFVGRLEDNGAISDIQNLGSDINSPKDDFAYIIDTASRKGYFSSNKEGGKGSDDIYKFLETRKLHCTQTLNGIINDAETGAVLPGTKVTLYEKEIIKNVSLSDSSGTYSFLIECGKTYTIRTEKPDYTTTETNITIEQSTEKRSLPIALKKAICKVAIGDDLGKCFDIRMIYFDVDKANIGIEAAVDLEKILVVLSDNPKMKLDIRSHTDSRHTTKYNEVLSDRRTKSTIKWLIKNGINQNQLTGRGYGESQLVNKCSDGISCTEEEHQANRRSQFVIAAL